MIIARLGGGLGNQMFQYAFGRALSIKNNETLLLDTSTYGAHTDHAHYREYGLAYFKIQAKIAALEEIEKVKYPHGKLWRKIKNAFEYRILKRHHIKFEAQALEKKGDLYLEGYWQSEKYFKNIRDIIVKEFTLKNPLSPAAAKLAETISKAKNSVSLHVRRGDYVENEKARRIYGTHCDQAYYARALEIIERETGGKEPVIFVFSDDIEWTKNNLKFPYETIYTESHDMPDYERLILMSLCQNHIICNSTFGWWSAWLDNKKDKIVVAPTIWIPGIDLPIHDIIPPEWIRA